MLLFIVRFDDNAERYETRKQYLDAHIKWLDENRDHVLVGGSLREALDDQPIGGLWIVRAESKSAVESLIESDPFWAHGLRSSVEILHWSKAFEDRLVEV